MAGMFFDESLMAFATCIVETLGPEALRGQIVLRDTLGRLALISSADLVEPADLRARLAPYVGEQPFCKPDSAGIDWILADANPVIQAFRWEGQAIDFSLIDRRIVGADWNRPPQPSWKAGEPARFVFASLKGGVGRSTALAVVATHLALQGKKVLALDLDLEAPGLGHLLLDPSAMPEFGAVDFYVEGGLTTLGPTFLEDMVASSHFAQHKGVLDVVPAAGQASARHPQNYLAKLARTYLETSCEEGESQSFLVRTQKLIGELCQLKSYDAVLVDARAGLNETTAAAILGLGADVLLFGIDTPQTFATADFLLSHLAGFPRDPEDDWVLRLRWVHAKASSNAEARTLFRDRLFDVCRRSIYRSNEVEFSLDDEASPHFAWPVLHDAHYLEFDPFSNADQLTQDLFDKSFGPLTQGIEERMDSE